MLIYWIPQSLFRCTPSRRRQRRAAATLSRPEHFEDRTLLSAAPIVTLPAGSLNYTENTAALVAGAGATVTDSDSANFNGGSLTAIITANADVDDQIEIKNVGTGAGQIGVSGVNVSFGGTTIGTFTGGTAGTALTVTFNANTTPAAVQALVNNITFRTVGDTPSTLARTLEFVVDDGTTGGVSTPVDKTINVTAVNDVPTIDVSGAPIAYSAGGTAIILTSAGTVSDVDSANFNGGSLTVDASSGASPNNTIAIKNQGTGAGQIGVSGSNVTFGGTTIGTFTGGNGTTPLVITFNANATPAAVQALVRQITFSTTAGASAGTTTLRFVVDDGDGGVSTASTINVNVSTAGNDAPVINVSGVPIDYSAGATAVLVAPVATVTDDDSANFDSGTLTVDASSGASLNNTIAIKNQGTGVGQIGVTGSNVTFGGTTIGSFTGGIGITPLVITFNANATPAAVEALVRQITFSTTDGASAGTTTLRFIVTDGDGGISTASTINVNVTTGTEGNLPPVVTTSAGSTNVKGGYQVVDPNITVTDPDSSNFDGGQATITASGNHDRLRLNHRRRHSSSSGVSIQGSNDVTVNGVVVGSISQGRRGGQTLTITFNASATPAIVQSVLRAVTVHANRSSDSHVVSFKVTDGDGGTSNTATKTVVRTRGGRHSHHRVG